MRLQVQVSRDIALGCGLEDAWRLLRNVPAVLQLLPWLDRVEIRDDEGDAYMFWLGPFGIGGLSGRLRCDVIVEREEAKATRLLRLRSRGDGDEGNTDCVVEMLLVAEGGDVHATASLSASPRRHLPALMPMTLVRRVAEGTARAGLQDALDAARLSLPG